MLLASSFRRLHTAHSALALLLVCSGAALAQTASPAGVTPIVDLSQYAPYAATPGYLRVGRPITLGARILPADASGSVTFTIDGTDSAPIPLTRQTLGDLYTFGDSVTANAYLGDPLQRYPFLLGAALNLTVTNLATPGYTACDVMPTEVLFFNVGDIPTLNPLYTLMIGTNDIGFYGTGGHEANFNLCHQATLAWLGIPRRNKVLAGDSGVNITSGSWAPQSISLNGCCLSALTSSVAGSSLRFTLASSGNAAFLWYQLQPSTPGSFTVSVDGGPPTPLISTGYTTVHNFTSYGLLRLPVAAGTHTFDVTAIDGSVGMLGVGSAPVSAAALPTVLATDIPNSVIQQASARAAYTADIQSNIAQLRADGLDIRFVSTAQEFSATPVNTFDGLHPNALGTPQLAQAFLDAIGTSAPLLHDTVTVAAASLTLSSLSLGPHQVQLRYSGDSIYAPADAISQGFGLYDGTSTLSLEIPSTTVSQQSPVTLTASVAQPSSDGEVEFFDVTSSGNLPVGTAWLNQIAASSAVLTLPGLTVGPHTFRAHFLGDWRYDGSVSNDLPVSVTTPYTSTSLASAATRYSARDSVALTASITPGSASGSITFRDGATVLGQASLSSGTASFTSSTLAVGIHDFTASYSGNASEDPSTSPVLSVEIDADSTTLAIAPLASPTSYGTALNAVASVSPSSATGTVSFLDRFVAAGQTASSSQTLGPAILSGGSASLALNALAPGVHTLTAVYAGDANDLPTASAPRAILVTIAASTLALAPLPSHVAYAAPLRLTATINPTTATGSITFRDLAVGAIGTAPLVNGSASLSITTLGPGLHTFAASYSGNTFLAPADSGTVSTSIDQAASTITLAPPLASINAGSALTLLAAVTPASATGTILFQDASRGVLGQLPVANGSALLLLPQPALGSYSITARYSGDSQTAASISAAVATQVILTPASVTLATSDPSPSEGAIVTLTAAVTPTGATGSITFLDGGAPVGVGLLRAGKAALTFAFRSNGLHTLTAVYSGDGIDAPASSGPLLETVAALPTATFLTLAQNNLVAGSSVTVNVQVHSSSSTPTGSVTLRTGGTSLAQAPLANASAGVGYATLTFSTASLGVGTVPLTAFYSGDKDDQPSDSSAVPVPLTVLPIPDSLSLSVSAAQIPITHSVSLTASLATPSNSPLTGSLTFAAHGTVLATFPINGSAAATFTYTPPAIGAYAITAAFTPVGFFAPAAATPVVLTVTPPLTAELSPSTLALSPGGTATAHLVLTPLSGFTGAVTSACQTSASFISCSVNAPLTLPSAAPVSAPVQITVAQSTARQSTAKLDPRSTGLRAAASAALLALLLPLFPGMRRQRTKRARLMLAAALVGTLPLAGCASGGNFNTVPSGPQTVTLSVTAAGIPSTAILTVDIAQ